MSQPLLQTDDRGIYCAAGDFNIDPWKPMPRAAVTHAHADHARPGAGPYLGPAARPSSGSASAATFSLKGKKNMPGCLSYVVAKDREQDQSANTTDQRKGLISVKD